MQIYTSDRTSPRGFQSLWFARVAGVVFSLIVLGITAANSKNFNDIYCSVPDKLSYNLAVSVLSLIALTYFVLSTGPRPYLRILPWFVWGQLALDALFFIFWLTAAATSGLSCDDLCNACAGNDWVYNGNQYCTCYVLFQRDISPAPRSLLERSSRASLFHGSTSRRGSTVAAKIAFDVIMTVIFGFCLGATIAFIYRSRNSSSTTTAAPVPTTTTEPSNLEGGGMASTATAPTYNQGAADPNHNNQMPAQGGYTGQPMQQAGYPQQQTMTQPQYTEPQPSYPPSTYPQGQKLQQGETMLQHNASMHTPSHGEGQGGVAPH